MTRARSIRLGMMPVALALALSTLACSGAAAGAAGTFEHRFSAPDARRARRLAPDLVIASEQALAKAREHERGGHADAASDEITRARLLLDAAVAEADRVTLEERARSADERARAADLAAAADEAEGDRLRADVRRLAAARRAREVAEQSLALAEADEARRAGRRGAADDPARREAARVLLDRARALLATAETLGADEAAVRAARAAVDLAAQDRQDAAHALASADRAQSLSQVALGAARRQSPVASADELVALVDDARAAGLRAARSERGVAVTAPAIFQGATARLSASGTARIGRLASLVRAHPAGRVRLEVAPARGTSTAARFATLRDALVHAGVEAARLEPGEGRSAAIAADAADLVFLAFATEP